MKHLMNEILPFVSLILIISLLSLLKPDEFLNLDNVMNVLRRSAVFGIMAVGMTFVIVSEGIDLSVGSMLALCGMCATGAMAVWGWDPWMGGGLGVGMGMLCGLTNGLLITRLKLPPFIVTLGGMSLFRGMALVINDSRPFNVPDFQALGTGFWWGIPISVWILMAVVALASFLLKRSTWGRYAIAIGSNEEAAFHAGVPVQKVKMAIYTFAGALVGLAAMIHASRVVSGQPTAGQAYELDVIAAVVIGGASLSGGRGTIGGAIIGTLLIQLIRNGCNLLGISTEAQFIVIGLIIILAVSLDQSAKQQQR